MAPPKKNPPAAVVEPSGVYLRIPPELVGLLGGHAERIAALFVAVTELVTTATTVAGAVAAEHAEVKATVRKLRPRARRK
jgi:hypothetical protein